MHCARFITCNDMGEHYYLRTDGSTVQVSKSIMRDGEAHRVWPELGMPGYDPFWDYHWHLNLRRIKEERFVQSLTAQQRENILRGEYGDS